MRGGYLVESLEFYFVCPFGPKLSYDCEELQVSCEGLGHVFVEKGLCSDIIIEMFMGWRIWRLQVVCRDLKFHDVNLVYGIGVITRVDVVETFTMCVSFGVCICG